MGRFFDDRLGCVRHKLYYFILGNVVVPRHVVFNEHLFERTRYIDDAKEQNGFAEIIHFRYNKGELSCTTVTEPSICALKQGPDMK